MGNHTPFFLFRGELTVERVLIFHLWHILCRENKKASFSLCKVSHTLHNVLAENSWFIRFYFSPLTPGVRPDPLVYYIWLSPVQIKEHLCQRLREKFYDELGIWITRESTEVILKFLPLSPFTHTAKEKFVLLKASEI